MASNLTPWIKSNEDIATDLQGLLLLATGWKVATSWTHSIRNTGSLTLLRGTPSCTHQFFLLWKEIPDQGWQCLELERAEREEQFNLFCRAPSGDWQVVLTSASYLTVKQEIIKLIEKER